MNDKCLNLDVELPNNGIGKYIKWVAEKSPNCYNKLLEEGVLVNNYYEPGKNGKFQIHQRFSYKNDYFSVLIDNMGIRYLYKCNPPKGQEFPWELCEGKKL